MAWSAQSFKVGQIPDQDDFNQGSDNITAVRVKHIGSSNPPELSAGVNFINNAATPWLYRHYDGSAFITHLKIDATNNAAGPVTLRVIPGSDITTDLIVVDVTGSPTIGWQEALDKFTSTKGIRAAGWTTSGYVHQPNAPACLVRSTDAANQYGDGSTVTVMFSSELFDQGADFNNGTYTFTAPVTGKYQVDVQVSLTNLNSTVHERVTLDIVTSNRTYSKEYFQSGGITRSQDSYDMEVLADMDANDTLYVQVTVTGASNDVGIDGTDGASTAVSTISINLWSED